MGGVKNVTEEEQRNSNFRSIHRWSFTLMSNGVKVADQYEQCFPLYLSLSEWVRGVSY